MVGIYKITNKITKEVYVGQSTDIDRRKGQHLNKGKTGKSFLYLSMRVWGSEHFEFEIIEECGKRELDWKEQHYVMIEDSFVNGLNMTIGGNATVEYSLSEVFKYKGLKELLPLINRLTSHYNYSSDTIERIKRISLSGLFAIDNELYELRKLAHGGAK